MDSNSRKVLRFLLNKNHNPSGYMRYAEFYPACSKSIGLSDHKIMACMRFLRKEGFISGGEKNGEIVGFELEHKAYMHRHFARVAVFDFLVRSILVPVVVAALTAIATVLIARLTSGAI